MEQNPIVGNSFKPEAITLYKALRTHSLGELSNKDAKELREYSRILTDKISDLNTKLATQNLPFSHIGEITEDVRWYTKINDQITLLLTASFHVK